MNEELTTIETNETETDYVAAIQELQNTTVSKTQYDKLKSENKKLLDALVRGEKIEQEIVNKPSIEQLRKELFASDLDNLDYAKTALKLRKALMEKGERDPFLPVGEKVSDTAEMYESAQKVADGLQYCVDFAEGDSGIFTAQLQRITKESALPKQRR